MRVDPPSNLVTLLSRLKLATAEQLQGVAPHVRRLAGELPDFESVWVDALVQARLLTPFQAGEINAGRGEGLLFGPYVISRPLASPQYADCYAARHVETGAIVRLYVVRRSQRPTLATARALEQLTERLSHGEDSANEILESGIGNHMAWVAWPTIDGTTAGEWMSENGRFPPQAVLQIAREMTSQLLELEQQGITHGDLSATGLVIGPSGHVAMPMCGLRAIVRASEGYSFNDLQPEAYDYLAPERIAQGSRPNLQSDLYACGCLWWHLLTGRAPCAGGNSLSKLRAVHAGRIPDVRQLAPDVPEELARAIELCLARDPSARPRSFAELTSLLGPPTRTGCAAVSQCAKRGSTLWHRSSSPKAQRGRSSRRVTVTGALATAAVLAIIASWPAWRARPTIAPNIANAPAQQQPETARQKPAESVVVQASAASPSPTDTPVRPAVAVVPAEELTEDVTLPTDKVVRLSKLELKPGQRVHGRAGKRARVSVPNRGLLIDCEDVSFEGIDFIWESEGKNPSPAGASAMLLLEARSVEFRGCSFSTSAERPPSAIAWLGDEQALAGCEIVASDCVFNGLSAVVDCQGASGVSLELNNSLCVASGPIVRLHRWPRAEESAAMTLDHVTTRGDSSVLECRYGRVDESAGIITITANDSAFDSNPRGALLRFSGSQPPGPLLKSIDWNGQGSLVTPQMVVAMWRNGAKKSQILPEEDLEVGGLVRSEVEFSGSAEGPPSASRITRWQVPLRSDEPPGAATHTLFLPAP